MVKLTKALMMHANDLFDLTNSQVMILVETPSGDLMRLTHVLMSETV